MIATTELRLVLVTPETTLLDVPVQSLKFPLFDGQIGVLPGRAPLVGRLGSGLLEYRSNSETGSYFISGGFTQIKGSVVTILTDSAIATSRIDVSTAESELEAAKRLPGTTDEERAAKEKAVQSARSKFNLGRRK